MFHWLIDQYFWLQRYCLRHAITAGATLVLVYFVFHGLHGDRGYFARQDTMRILQEREELLTSLNQDRIKLESKVAAMEPGQSQADMVQEELYNLGYIKPGDVIIYRHELDLPVDNQ